MHNQSEQRFDKASGETSRQLAATGERRSCAARRSAQQRELLNQRNDHLGCIFLQELTHTRQGNNRPLRLSATEHANRKRTARTALLALAAMQAKPHNVPPKKRLTLKACENF